MIHFKPGSHAYNIYNTRNELMKGFEGGGEIMAWLSVGSIAAFNAECDNGIGQRRKADPIKHQKHV